MTEAKHLLLGSLLAIGLTGCGAGFEPISSPTDEVCASCSEQDLNAPADGAADDPVEINPNKQSYFFPAYSATSGISQTMWNKTEAYYNQHWAALNNTRYVTMINLGLKSNKKRFFVLDLATGAIEKHNTSAGKGSDPDGDGFATMFSNEAGSNKSSLGFYETGATYNGKHGRSLRLHGKESTNSNAFARAIVVHGADYVNETNSTAGRSLGCPALDNNVAQPVIDKIKSGSLLLIDRT
jgi:hypothetical protein